MSYIATDKQRYAHAVRNIYIHLKSTKLAIHTCDYIRMHMYTCICIIVHTVLEHRQCFVLVSLLLQCYISSGLRNWSSSNINEKLLK